MPSSKSKKDSAASSFDDGKTTLGSSSGGFSSFFGRKRRVAIVVPAPAQPLPIEQASAPNQVSFSPLTTPRKTPLGSRQYKAMSRSMSDLTQFAIPDDVAEAHLSEESSPMRAIVRHETPFASETITKSGWANRKTSKKEAQWKLSRIFLRESKLYFFKPPPDIASKAFDVHLRQQSALSAALMGAQEGQLHPAEFEESVREILFDLMSTTPQRFQSSHRLQEEGRPKIAFFVDRELIVCYKPVNNRRVEGWALESKVELRQCQAVIHNTAFDDLLELSYGPTTRRFKCSSLAQFMRDLEQAALYSSRPATAPLLLPTPGDLTKDKGKIVSGSVASLCKHVLERPEDEQSLLLIQTMGFWHPVQAILAEFGKHLAGHVSAIVELILLHAPSVLLDAPSIEALLKLIERCSTGKQTALIERLWKQRTALLSIISMETVICDADSNNLKEGLTADIVLSLQPGILAAQLHIFHRFYFDAWNPASDRSLFFAQSSRNPLIFSARHMHFLTYVVLHQILDVSIDTDQRAALCMHWIKFALASKKLGDMTGWLAIAMAICAPSIVRLSAMWTQIDKRVRDTVEREWSTVIRDLFRRSLGGTLVELGSAHVLAPDAANLDTTTNAIIPFYGDLCNAVAEIRLSLKPDAIQLDHVAAAYEAVAHALANWQSVQEKTTSESIPIKGLASFQECFKRLNSLPMENRDLCSPMLRDLSFKCEPHLAIDDLQERKQHAEVRLGTAAFLPLLFADLLPMYRLFDASDLVQFSDPSRKLPNKTTGLRRLNSFPPTQRAGHYTTGHDALDETTRARHAASVSDWKMLHHLKDLTGVQDNQLTASNEMLILRNAAQEPRAAKARPQSIIMETRKRDSIISRRSSLVITEDDASSRPSSKRGQLRDCVVKAGTLEMLIDLAISDLVEFKGVSFYPLLGPALEADQISLDRAEYAKILLASMRSYCAPNEFLQHLALRVDKASGVCQLVVTWMSHFPADFFAAPVQEAFETLVKALPGDHAVGLQRQWLRLQHSPLAVQPEPDMPGEPFDITIDISQVDAAKMLTSFDTFIESTLNAVSLYDWMRFYELLEYESLDPKAFFTSLDYSGSHDVQIADCASLLHNINKSGTHEPLMHFIPASIQLLFAVWMRMQDWIVAQVASPEIDLDLRCHRMRFFLDTLAIAGVRMRPFDITVSGTPGEEKKTQIVPSFAASAIATGLVHSQSRLFMLAWSNVSESLGNGEYCGSLVELIARIEVESTDGPLVPCTCWLTERMLEIACCLPDTMLSNPDLLNFDKRQYIYNLLTNLDLLGPFTVPADARFSFLLTRVPSHDVRAVRDAAVRENMPKRVVRVFGHLVIYEQEKIRRDLKQRETVERLLKDARRAAQRKQLEVQRSAEALRRPAAAKSRYGMNSLLRAVRPLSVAITGSWSEKLPVVRISPADLPESCSIREGTKPVLTADLVKAHIQLTSRADFIFTIRSEDGIETHVQAPTLHEAEDWVKTLTRASIDGARKRQSMIQEDRKQAFEVPQFSPRSSQVLNVSTAMFGVNLDVLCEREQCTVPNIAITLMDAVERKGLEEVGIYRISGSLATVNRLKRAFDSCRPVDLDDELWSDVHAIAGAFKLWLRELPEPVMTYGLYADFLATVEMNDPAAKNARLKYIVHRLPKPNFALLKRLLEHLQKVTDYEVTNHMYAHNLAIVFGPNVLQPVPSAMSIANSMHDLGKVQTVMRNLILQYHAVFGAADEELDEATEEDGLALDSISPSTATHLLPAILEG